MATLESVSMMNLEILKVDDDNEDKDENNVNDEDKDCQINYQLKKYSIKCKPIFTRKLFPKGFSH